MAQPELLQVLEKTASQNPNDQTLALEFLKQAAQLNFPEFVKQLSSILSNTSCTNFVRQAAGLQLKNVLVAKEDITKKEYLLRWLNLPENIRVYIKDNVIRTLGTEPFRPSIAAQCVAAIACAEIPTNSWPGVIESLQTNVTGPNNLEALKESSLETLGYICQDINPLSLVSQANQILTAIVHGLRKEEPSNNVRLAAATAMLNSLEFTKNNFDNQEERNIIMQVICEASQCPETRVKVVALQCLVKIMSLYYQLMEYYMSPALFSISISAMQSNMDEVAMQGIEFWSNVCEEEIQLALEAEEALEQGRAPEQVSKHYARGALSHLIPFLTDTLAKQSEHDDDDWNPAKSAGVCIMLLAQCTGDSIIAQILPFIERNLKNESWRYREASIMAFGSILDGPDESELTRLVELVLEHLIGALSDPHLLVRDTAAWCIGRICDTCEVVVTREDVLSSLLPALSTALQDEPRVAANICWTISSLAKASYAVACRNGTDDSGQPETYVLTPCIQSIVIELIKVTDRSDAHVANLRIAAYETLMELIKNSPKDCYHVVQETTLIVLKKLEQLLSLENSFQLSLDRGPIMDLESLLCATLQSVLRKIRKEDAPCVGDQIMRCLLQIMQRCAGSGSGGVMEDALMAISTLIEALGLEFLKYMNDFQPHLLLSLSKHDESQICSAAIGVLADLCRALEAKIEPYLDDFVKLLFYVIQDETATPTLKFASLSCFGDIALAIGGSFTKYLGPVSIVLTDAVKGARLNEGDTDFEKKELVDQLRESCVEAYSGMVVSLRNTKERLNEIYGQLQNMIDLIILISSSNSPDSLIGAAAGLIGDLVTAFGVDIIPYLDNQCILTMLTQGRRSKLQKTKTISIWATKQIRKFKPTN